MQPSGDVRAIDVSRWQGGIDWGTVRASGVGGGWIKVGGADVGLYRDGTGAVNMAGAEASGLPWGTYYFAVPRRGSAAIDQARHAVSLGHGRGALWPMIDLEANPDRLGPDELDAFCVEFCNETCRLTGRESIVYTNVYFGVGHRLPGVPACPLWIANYGANRPGVTPPNFSPALPMAWGSAGWAIWQYNSVTMVPGIPSNTVDQNTVREAFWRTMLEPAKTSEDDMPALVTIMRTQVGSAWAQTHLGRNDISHFLLVMEATRVVRHIGPDALNAELFWLGRKIEDVWEVPDNILAGRYRYEPAPA